MKLRDLSIAAFVLAVLVGVLYWSNHRKPADAAVTAAVGAPIKVLSLDPSNVVRLSIHREDRPQVDLSRNGAGDWQITAPKAVSADQDAVTAVLSSLSSLSAEREVDDHANDVSQYGLATPKVEIDATTKDNKTQRILVGDLTPAGGAYYFMVAGDPRLFTLATYDKDAIDKTSDDLRDKRLLTADFDQATQIEFMPPKPGPDVTFAHDKDAWQIIKPEPERTESEAVDELVRSLQGVRLNPNFADQAKNAAAFNAAQPFAIAKVTGSFGTQQLEIRKAKDKDDYYAKSTVQPGVYQLASADETGLQKSLDDFRKKVLFDFGFEDPNKIEIHDGAKAYFISHSGSDWWGLDGKKLDASTVGTLLNSLRGLSASGFATSGFTAPALEITVTSDDNKRTEKVQIAKNGDSYIAKRENESALYELPSSAVTDLQQSAGSLKPASTNQK